MDQLDAHGVGRKPSTRSLYATLAPEAHHRGEARRSAPRPAQAVPRRSVEGRVTRPGAVRLHHPLGIQRAQGDPRHGHTPTRHSPATLRPLSLGPRWRRRKLLTSRQRTSGGFWGLPRQADTRPCSLLVNTGLRRGEALALRWSDVDLDAGVLRVRGTLARVDGALVVTEPKTAKSRRSVRSPPRLAGASRGTHLPG